MGAANAPRWPELAELLEGEPLPRLLGAGRVTSDHVIGDLLDWPAILHEMPVQPDVLDPARGDPCAGCSHTVVLITFAAPQGPGDAEGDRISLTPA